MQQVLIMNYDESEDDELEEETSSDNETISKSNTLSKKNTTTNSSHQSIENSPKGIIHREPTWMVDYINGKGLF